jgi:large subunit ribosomal protein L9
MQVILLEDMPKLGTIGDLVSVKDGYARNFLLPRRKALTASIRNVKRLEHEKRIANKKLAEAKEGADALAKALGELSLTITRKVGEQDKLFGSVTTMDIEKALSEAGHDIDRRQILLDNPIKEVGSFEVAVKIHKQVNATVKFEVAGE